MCCPFGRFLEWCVINSKYQLYNYRHNYSCIQWLSRYGLERKRERMTKPTTLRNGLESWPLAVQRRIFEPLRIRELCWVLAVIGGNHLLPWTNAWGPAGSRSLRKKTYENLLVAQLVARYINHLSDPLVASLVDGQTDAYGISPFLGPSRPPWCWFLLVGSSGCY